MGSEEVAKARKQRPRAVVVSLVIVLNTITVLLEYAPNVRPKVPARAAWPTKVRRNSPRRKLMALVIRMAAVRTRACCRNLSRRKPKMMRPAQLAPPITLSHSRCLESICGDFLYIAVIVLSAIRRSRACNY